MTIKKNISLQPYNTFGIAVLAKKFISVQHTDDLIDVLKEVQEPIFILGGGSNILLTKDIDALVIHIAIKGRRIENQENGRAEVTAMAGENWHEFVLFTLENNLGGLENMSLIPGNVGTTPIQNIGAYGAEIKDTFVRCEAINVKTQELRTFYKEDCEFGYRESIFKNTEKGNYIIVSVTFSLSTANHQINTGYGDIKRELELAGITNPTIKDVSNAVISIRKSKLPDPAELGNSGSFFKNPIVPLAVYERAKRRYPDMPHYPVSENEVKVPAGWLIEKAGFKGYRAADAGVHAKQALVLVNYGQATGADVLALSKKIQESIFNQYGISIEAEVNVV
jgi:UDP-N-acetylmuramate dehydrogenase